MKNMNWNDYFDLLIDNGRKYIWHYANYPKENVMTFIELHEMAGHLLMRDLSTKMQDISTILAEIFEQGGYCLADLMAAYCVENSVENAEDVLIQIKKSIADYYEDEIQKMLDEHWEKVA